MPGRVEVDLAVEFKVVQTDDRYYPVADVLKDAAKLERLLQQGLINKGAVCVVDMRPAAAGPVPEAIGAMPVLTVAFRSGHEEQPAEGAT